MLHGRKGVLGAARAEDTALSTPVRLESGVSGHIHPVLAITKNGTLVAAFCKKEYAPYLITRSTDRGATWSKPEPFAPTVSTPLYPGSLTRGATYYLKAPTSWWEREMRR